MKARQCRFYGISLLDEDPSTQLYDQFFIIHHQDLFTCHDLVLLYLAVTRPLLGVGYERGVYMLDEVQGMIKLH
jgi:hypothetical protein